MCCNKAQVALISKNTNSVKFILLDNKHILQIINTLYLSLYREFITWMRILSTLHLSAVTTIISSAL